MKKRNIRLKGSKRETQEYSNPFNSLYFWMTIATTDAGFFENEKQDNEKKAVINNQGEKIKKDG